MPCFESGLVQSLEDGVLGAAPGELPAGDIYSDGYAGKLGHLGLPLFHLPAGFVQGPLPEREDQPGFFGEGDEIGRQDQSAFGMLPAKQGFDFDQLSGFQVENGLVNEG